VRALPAVCCGGSPNLLTNLLPGCYIDGVRTGYLAARHLLDRGHRRIAFLGDRMPWTDEASHSLMHERPRWRGYRKALEEAGIGDESDLLLAPFSSDQSTSDVLRAALTGPSAPTAIVAYNDLAAVGAYRVVAELGRRIPDDVAIVGVDDVELAAELHPPLTSVSQRMEEATTMAARMLLRMIDDPFYRGEVVHLEPWLHVRAST
jgi:LacI family transcriptional regulator